MYGKAFEDAIITMAAIILIVGVLIGGALFEGIPLLFHHLSIHWH